MLDIIDFTWEAIIYLQNFLEFHIKEPKSETDRIDLFLTVPAYPRSFYDQLELFLQNPIQITELQIEIEFILIYPEYQIRLTVMKLTTKYIDLEIFRSKILSIIEKTPTKIEHTITLHLIGERARNPI